METLLLPFSPRFIVLTICAVVTALLLGIGIFDHNPRCSKWSLIPIVIFGALTLLGIRDLTAEEPRGAAQLSDLGAYALPAGRDPAGDAAVFLREREGRHAVLAATPARVVYQRAKMVLDKRPFGTQEDVYREGYEWMHHSVAPKPHAARAVPHHHRRPGLHQAVFGVGLQHLGDEFWRAQPQRRARAERRRQEGRLRA